MTHIEAATMNEDSRVEVENPQQLSAPLDRDTTVKAVLVRGRSTKRRGMATQKQLEANRRNAQRSTGPRTPDGKQIAAQNAIRHGFTSTNVLLPGDDPAEYQRFVTGVRLYFSPVGELEKFLVQLISDTSWGRLRFSRIEAGVLRFLVSDGVEPDVLAEASSRLLETLSRYGTTKERTLTRAMRDLERLQDRRRRDASRPLQERLIRARDQQETLMALVGKTEKLEGSSEKSGEVKA
jgi:hypothetical protein